MSVYPPPLSQSQIFNPTYFSETTTAIIGGGSSAPAVDYLEYPDAQGAETFSSNAGDNTLVVGATELSIGYDKLTTPKGIALNGQGFAYDNGTAVSTTTWSGLQTKIEAIQALAPASDSTTLNVNNAITIQNGESPIGTNNIILSASAGDNQLLLNDDAGEVGYVLTSGGADGSMTWAVGGGGGSQNLASVLAVSPAGVANAEQTITLSKVGYLSADGTNVVSGSGMAMDFQGTGVISNLSFKNDITPNTSTLQQYDSSLFPPIDNQPQNETYSEAGKIEIKHTDKIDDVASTDYLSLEPTRVGIAVANGLVDYGTSGQVLTTGGEAGNLSWTTTPFTSLEQAIQTGSGFASSSFQIVGAIGTDIHTEMSSTKLEAQSITTNGIDETTHTNSVSPEMSQIKDTVTSTGISVAMSLTPRTLHYTENDIIEASYDYDHLNLSKTDKDSNLLEASLYPNELTLANSLYLDSSLVVGRNKFQIGADEGVAGQVIGKDVNGDLAWVTGSGATPSLAEVLAVAPEGVANADQSIYLSRGVNESYPYGIQTILNDSGGVLTTSFQLTENYGEKFKSGLLSPTQVYMTTEDNTTPGVLNTRVSQLTANSLALQTITGSSPEINLAQITVNDIVLLSQPGFPTSSGIQIKRTKQIGLMTDNTYDYGTAGQVLTSGGSDGVLSWADGGATPSLAQVLAVAPAGVGDANQTITLTDGVNTSTIGTSLQLTDDTYSTTLGQNGLISTRPALEIQNDTLINIGTNIDVSNLIEIGNLSSTISLVGEVNAPTPATNISSTIIPTTAWVNTFFATISSLSDYLTTASASATYQTLAGMSDYLTTASASATYQTLAGMSAYLTTSSASATYQTLAGMASYLTTATASSTYQTLAGMGSYLTTATASSTYQTLSGMSAYLTITSANSTFQTIAGMSSYLTTATASSTYQTLAGMSAYLTTATASSTYQTISGLGSALATVTPITIGTNAGSANAITIGNNSGSTSTYSLVGVKGKFSINDVLFSGGEGGTTALSVASYTIPADALRNSLYTLVISGTANPTPLNFPTDDTGGKYITIFNAGSQGVECRCSASPTRLFVGGNNGLAGGTTYSIRANQVVQFLSSGSSGFLVFAQTNPNSNQTNYPYPLQTQTTNQRITSTRITGASVNGTFTYASAFNAVPAVVLTAEDATGNHTMTLRTSTTSGFTYVSSTGSFPTALSIHIVGT